MGDSSTNTHSNLSEFALPETNILNTVTASPVTIAFSFITTLVAVLITTRIWTTATSKYGSTSSGAKTVRMLPYSIPWIGHSIQFGVNGPKLLRAACNENPEGIFAIKLGGSTHNILASQDLVKTAMQQRETSLAFFGVSWFIMERFFGTPHRLAEPYKKIWDELMMCMSNTLMREPGLSTMLDVTIGSLEANIPDMISFMQSPIDMQPWERSSHAVLTSCHEPEVEVSLMSLMRDMLGYASVPALMGRSFLDHFPHTLQDVYTLDLGVNYLIMGLPRWFPLPVVTRAHIARKRLRESIKTFWIAMDAVADGADLPQWGDMEDVSLTMKERHAAYRRNGIPPADREDISILWAMIVNANLLVFWHTLYILSTPGLLSRIREEVKPYAKVSRGESILGYHENPKIEISHVGLAKNCPLFKSTFFEALRLCSHPMSVRQAQKDIILSGAKTTPDTPSFLLRKAEYVSIPHDLHMQDPRYFKNPETFDPERYMVRKEDGTTVAEQSTSRPFGGGPSMCKGRIFAERECMSQVAGILALWDIRPANGEWEIPVQQRTTAVSLPIKDIRVRVKRRRYPWDI